MFALVNKDVNFKYLQALAIMEVLGLGSMPVRILPSLIKSERNNFNFKIFKNNFDEILLISNHRIKIRCLRLIQQAIITNIDKKIYKLFLQKLYAKLKGSLMKVILVNGAKFFRKH